MTTLTVREYATPFNGAIEVGLRALALLVDAYPVAYSLQRLVIFDYLAVHSDDLPGGPVGLHPKTPHRGGELLVRRGAMQEGLLLYESRGLLERQFEKDGILYAATDRAAGFLDALQSSYTLHLRERTSWLVEKLGLLSDKETERMVREHIGEWGAEFTMESVLWMEEC